MEMSERGLGWYTDPAKVEPVRDWLRPQNMKELRSLLSFLGYYRHFIKGFSKIAQPLNELLKGYTSQQAGKNMKISMDHSRIKRHFLMH
jgi:hypothetical protein